MEIWELSAGELTAAYERGELTPTLVVGELLARIEGLDPGVGAFRQVTADRAITDAATLSDELARGERRSPLHGIPVAIKELFDVAGTDGCYGSEVLAGRTSPDDAEAVRRLRSAGAIVMGTTRAHEFGWGITNQHSTLGSTRNPWDTERVPGGSSGGSAAALATGMVPLALGSDTGGSIRIPAGFCGVAGIKPTYGRIPKRGAVALAPSLDHPGPMARRVADVVAALRVLAGFDPADPSTLAERMADVEVSVDGLRIAVAIDLHITPLSRSYLGVFDDVVQVLEAAGALIGEVEIMGAEEIRPTFASIQMAEAYYVHNTTLGTFPTRADSYGEDVRRRLEMAAEVSVSEYIGAQQRALGIKRVFDEAMTSADVIVTPVSGGGPSSVDSPDVVEHLGSELPFRDLVMDYTVPQDLTGMPAAVVRAGTDDDGLPVGVQFTAARGREDLALAAAAAAETAVGALPQWPEITMSAKES